MCLFCLLSLVVLALSTQLTLPTVQLVSFRHQISLLPFPWLSGQEKQGCSPWIITRTTQALPRPGFLVFPVLKQPAPLPGLAVTNTREQARAAAALTPAGKYTGSLMGIYGVPKPALHPSRSPRGSCVPPQPPKADCGRGVRVLCQQQCLQVSSSGTRQQNQVRRTLGCLSGDVIL